NNATLIAKTRGEPASRFLLLSLRSISVAFPMSDQLWSRRSPIFLWSSDHRDFAIRLTLATAPPPHRSTPKNKDLHDSSPALIPRFRVWFEYRTLDRRAK